MQDRPHFQPRPPNADSVTSEILRPHDHLGSPGDARHAAGDGQATLPAILGPGGTDQHGVRELEQAALDLHDREREGLADLRRGKSQATSSPHRSEHLVGEASKPGVGDADPSDWHAKPRIREDEDLARQNAGRSGPSSRPSSRRTAATRAEMIVRMNPTKPSRPILNGVRRVPE